ncbi:MAG: hypothetical protein U0527_05935 [Candidatus Eisenbacteria bacterium]
MIALLGEVLTSATFPADQVDIARAQLVASLKERTEDTDSRSRRAALEAGYGANSPTRALPRNGGELERAHLGRSRSTAIRCSRGAAGLGAG